MSNLQFSHLDSDGSAKMVNVSNKNVTRRTAKAEAIVKVGSELCTIIKNSGGLKKGNVIDTARLAGILASKRTHEIIPLCHPLLIDSIHIHAQILNDRIQLISEVECEAKTGVEMEAMTAVFAAALTVYDMVKSASKSIEICSVRLLEKTGGKSGDWRRNDD